jgi:M6 family metalloprotease-like protein
MRHLLTMLALVALLPGAVLAFPLPSAEQIQQLQAEGRWDTVRTELMALRRSTVRTQDETETLRLIDAGYGLPAQRTTPGDPAASPAANLDGNMVVDERDVLELGYSEPGRSASTTLPYGTAAQSNQPRCLVLLIKFPDKAPTDIKNMGEFDVNHDADWAEDRWFDLTAPGSLEDTSVAYYFKTASYGKLELTGDVFNNPAVCDSEGWITSSETYVSIGNGTSDYAAVMQDAITQIDPHVDFTEYDSNGDGLVDGLVTIYAGAGDGNGSRWYFRWVQQPGYATSGDGVRIGAGVWVSEEGYVYHYCHEFGHELGLPDLYDTDNGVGGGEDTDGGGFYTLMSHWTDATGRIPVMPDAWSRTRLRWVEPVDILTTASQSIVVNRATATSNADTVFRIWRNGAPDREYFLCEFRDCDHSFDQGLPNPGGLMLWHIDEGRTTANNFDNAYTPLRVAPECADNDNSSFVPMSDPWFSGFNGADGFDFFADTTTPNSKDNSGASSFVSIDPTTDASGTTMTVTVSNAGSGLPTLSFDSPAAGANVSGNVTFDVTSNAGDRVEYYVNDCLKHVEAGPAPYTGFTWDTLTALNGACTLRAVAYNAGSGNPVRVLERSVTVNNAQVSGKALDFSENFNSYGGDSDNALLGAWNLHEDGFGLDIQHITVPGSSTPSIAFAQTSFIGPPGGNAEDPNAGVYEGQDDDWLMSPRINLGGNSGLSLSYKVAFRAAFFGELLLQTQISADDGATWTDIDGMTNNSFNSGPYQTGLWDLAPGIFTHFDQRTVDLTPWTNQQVYIRFLFVGGAGYGPGFAVDDITLDGTPILLASATPARAKVGDQVVLAGNGFGATQGTGEVRFSNGSGGFIAQPTVVSWSNTSITVTVPAGAKSHTQGVWVHTDSDIDTNAVQFKVILAPPVLGGVVQQ